MMYRNYIRYVIAFAMIVLSIYSSIQNRGIISFFWFFLGIANFVLAIKIHKSTSDSARK